MLVSRIENFFTKFLNKNKFKIKTHKNFCDLYYFRKEKFYRKISKDKIGNLRLKEEKKGLIWYCKLNKINPNKIIKNYHFRKQKNYLDLYEINGYKLKSWHPLKKNFNHILKFYYYHKRTFPKSSISKVHGDLTLDNILFKKKDFFVIDWEFFGVKKKHKGYDIGYLFLSSICLPYLVKKQLSKNDIKLFLELWKLLYKDKINEKIIFDPFNYYEKNIIKEKFFRESLKLSKSKFFPFLLNKKIKKKILEIIKKNIVKK